jgi:hypothetical protein
LGWSFRQRAREFNLAREIVQNGGSFNGNEEEGKKEKALTARETQFSHRQDFHWPLRRSTSREAFPIQRSDRFEEQEQ